MRNLEYHIDDMINRMNHLKYVKSVMCSELRRHGGHKGKVDNRVLVRLEQMERMEREYNDICDRYISLLQVFKFIRESPSSLLVFFDKTTFCADRLLIKKIGDKICQYLDDHPMVKRVTIYGGKGASDEDTLIMKIHLQLMREGFFDKIVSIDSFDSNDLNYWQLCIASQLNLTLLQNDAFVRAFRISENLKYASKCLFILDDVWNHKPELLDRIGIPELRTRKASKMELTVGSEVKDSLFYMHNRYFLFKIDRRILKLTNEVKVLVLNNSSMQALYDDKEEGADGGLSKFTTRQTLMGKSAQEVSDNIWEYLLDPMIGTIGLHGVGGVGKTTIVKNICNELANTDIFDIVIWVSMSKMKLDKINCMRLQDEIAMQLGLKLPGYEKRESTISEKLKIVGKCLIILDDVWETFSLSTIGIPSPEGSDGCKIMLTTRASDVCKNMDVDKQIRLAPLSEKEAWDLFISKSGDRVLDTKLELIAKEVVYECQGLPITIITVCHALKDEVNITAWRLALKELQSSHSIIYGEDMNHLLDVLKFGYDHLTNDQVRACFLCCAIFPEDYKFDSTEVIRYWMAENLIHNEGGIVESINDGLEILKELKDANMLESYVEGGIEWLKMHDLFRDLAIIVMRVERDFIVKAGSGIQIFASTGNEKISLIRNRILFIDPVDSPCTNTSTLLLRDNPLNYISFSFFSSMPNLQVLDMSYSGLSRLPPSLSELHKLRALFLNFCTALEIFPSLIQLKNLQFLSLRGTLIKELPQGIQGLISLISLDLSETIRLKHIKAGVISSLSNLEELQLQGSRLCKIDSAEVAHFFKEMRCLKQLAILTLSAVGFGDHLDMILHLQQYNLKIFSVNAYGSTLDYIEDE